MDLLTFPLPFAAGLLTLLIVVAASLVLLLREPGLERRLKGVREYVHRQLRVRKTREELARSVAEQAAFRDTLEARQRLREEIVEPDPGTHDALAGWEAVILGTVFYLGESVLMFGLGAWSRMGGLGTST
jgi:predicted Holliday junction resolvase-like endonuclease